LRSPTPEWFILSDEASPEIWKRAGRAMEASELSPDLKILPMQAYWFYVTSLGVANDANRVGMHANALAMTRFCIECLSLIELGLCRETDRESILQRWKEGAATPGHLRKWLAQHTWPAYGSGLWTEPWSDFMAKLAGAVQQYAHFTEPLAQWQTRLHHVDLSTNVAIMEFGPRLYDPPNASRITLYHALLNYCLGRLLSANHFRDDRDFCAQITRVGSALGKSKFLDGHKTVWDHQFWAMLWDRRTGEPFHE
jgi:hypothetical protein